MRNDPKSTSARNNRVASSRSHSLPTRPPAHACSHGERCTVEQVRAGLRGAATRAPLPPAACVNKQKPRRPPGRHAVAQRRRRRGCGAHGGGDQGSALAAGREPHARAEPRRAATEAARASPSVGQPPAPGSRLCFPSVAACFVWCLGSRQPVVPQQRPLLRHRRACGREAGQVLRVAVAGRHCGRSRAAARAHGGKAGGGGGRRPCQADRRTDTDTNPPNRSRPPGTLPGGGGAPCCSTSVGAARWGTCAARRACSAAGGATNTNSSYLTA